MKISWKSLHSLSLNFSMIFCEWKSLYEMLFFLCYDKILKNLDYYYITGLHISLKDNLASVIINQDLDPSSIYRFQSLTFPYYKPDL